MSSATVWSQFSTATLLGARQHLRNTLFVVLLVLLPIVFITTSFARTPDAPNVLSLVEQGAVVQVPVGMRNLHGAIMAPMTVAFLAGILGMFVMLVSREGDRRLVGAGFPASRLLLARLAVIAALSLTITAISVIATVPGFVPQQLPLFFLVNFITALQWAFIGAAVGTFLSAMSGTYLMFFAPMIDVGLLQNPMFPRDNVAWWVQVLPGYRPMEMLVDVSFTPSFDSGVDLLVALASVAGFALLGMLAFWRAIGGRR